MADRTVVYRLRSDATQFMAQMKAASASVQDAAGKMTAADKEGQKFRKGLDSLGGTAGKVGLVAAAGLGAAVLKAADFDEAMSQVQAATHESAEGMNALREAALKAGADTAFSASEAAAGIENLAKAGISTEDILGGALAGALDLAAAGGMEVADAAEAAAGAMAQFKLDGSEATHVADLLAAGAGKAQGDVSDMVFALKQAGTVSAQTGLSIEETTGTLAAMAEQSLLGSDAGTSFKTMLAALTPNSDKAAKAMEQYNIHAFDAQGNFVGMTELAGQLEAGLGDLTAEQRAMALETIFGSDAVRAASIVYDNGADGIQKWITNTDDAGYAAETAAIKLDNLTGDLEALGGSLETALIGTGSGSQGMLRGLTQSLTDAVNSYNDLGEGAKSGVAMTLAATATLGGGVFVFSKMVQSIAATREAMEALGLTSQKTQGMVAAAGKAMGVALAAGLAVAAGDLFDVDYSLDSMNRQLELLAAQGDAQGVLEGLSMSADTLGEALRDAAFNDFNMFGMGAAEEIEELDAALAGLDPDVAAETFKVLIEEGTKAGLTVAEVKRLFPQYAAELELTAKEAEATASSTDQATDATRTLGGAVRKTAEELEAEAEALKEARKAGVATAETFLGLGDSLNKAEKSLGQWMAEMEQGARALNNFNANSKKAAREGLDEGLILSLRAAGKEGALRMEQLANATQAEIKRANAAHRTQQRELEETADLTAKLSGMKPSVNVQAETGRAMQSFREVDQYLSSLNGKTATTYVNTVRTVTGPKGAAAFSQQADGSVLDFFANGGMRENHTAQIAPAGAWRIWAEPETGGEAYIPLAPSKRERSIDIWEEVGTRLGVQFQRFAAGSSGGKDDKKKKRRQVDIGLEEVVDFGPTAAQLAQIADDTARFYDEQERARRAEEQRAEAAEEAARAAREAAEEAAERQREHDEAVFEGQQRAWDQATDAAQAQKDAAQSMVDSVQQNMDRIGQAATSAFSGSWFTGEQQRGMWAGGAGTGDWRSQAAADISGLRERGSIISQLSGLGLSGAALEDLLGNQSNAGIQAMIGAGEIDDFAAMFAEREALMASVGAAAGQAGYGSDMASANAHLAQMNSQFAALTAAIEAARPITVLESVSATATAQELARLLSMTGAG